MDEYPDVRSSEIASLRREVASEIGRVEAVLSTQIGAVEKTLTARFDGLKWKIAGGVTAQLAATAALYLSRSPNSAGQTAIRALVRAFGIA